MDSSSAFDTYATRLSAQALSILGTIYRPKAPTAFERYTWFNDTLSVGVGEVCAQEDGSTQLVIEWAELVWEPIAE